MRMHLTNRDTFLKYLLLPLYPFLYQAYLKKGIIMSSEHSTLNYDLWMAASVGSREAIASIIALWEEMQQRIAALEAQAQKTPQVVLPDEDEEEEARGIIALRAALALHNSHLDDTSGPLVVGIGDIDPLLKRIQWQADVLNVYRQAVEEVLREEA